MRTLTWSGMVFGCGLILLIAACQSASTACPQAAGTPRWLEILPESLPTPTRSVGSRPVMVEIGGKTIPVDKIVEGPLCRDTWSGVVYVSCGVQVYRWEENPFFLENCDLKIEPGTVVYVAYHNNAAYYNGCSCHTNELGKH